MGKISIDVNGAKELAEKFENMSHEVEKKVKASVRDRTYQMEKRIKKDAPYDTGHLKRSIHSDFYNRGLSGEVSTNVNYAIYLELGTRKMAAQPFFFGNYIVARQDFTNDLKKILRDVVD